MRRSAQLLSTVTIGYKSHRDMPTPCAQRWDLRLSKAKLWDEYVETKRPSTWQLEDDRHMSPEFPSFTGYPMRSMRPGDGNNNPRNLLNKRMTQWSHIELQNRRDVPNSENSLFGKKLYDQTMHGIDVPTSYKLMKDLQKANRNDRKLSQNRFKIQQGAGFKSPPDKWEALPDEAEDDDD